MKKQSGKTVLTAISSGYIGLMMTFYLFYVGGNGFQGIAEGKFSAFVLLSGGYLALMLLMTAELALIGRLKLPSIRMMAEKSSWTQRMVVLYLLLSWLSAFLSPHGSVVLFGATRYEGALTITLYGLVFLFVSACGRVERWMLPVCSVSVCVFCLLCIAQLYGLNPCSLYPQGYNYFGAYVDYGGAYLGTIGNVDLVAAFLCLVIPVFWIGMAYRSGRTKWLLLLPLGLSVFVLLKMWVLAGVVGVLVGGILVLCLAPVLPEQGRKILRCVVPVGAITSLVLLRIFDPGQGMLHEVHMLLNGHWDDTFGSSRLYIWRNVVQRIPGQLLLGSGPDTMSLAQIPPITRFDERLNIMRTTYVDVAHNEYLNVLFHQGLLSLSAYLGVLLAAVRGWLRRSEKSAALCALGAAMICYCVQAFFGIGMYIVSIYFWLVLGLLDGECRRASECI